MRFSVVIAVYNKEAYIAKTLQSVLDQRYTDFEVVVVNDGSTDSSEEVIKSFTDPRIRYFNQSNRGAGAARNAAIARSTAPYIALLDADDYWHPDFLSEIDSLISSFPDQKVFATAIKIKRSGTEIIPKYSIPNLKKGEVRTLNFFQASYIQCVLFSSSTVIHRSVPEKSGNYNPDIKSGQDTDLWIRIGLHHDIVFLNKVLATYEDAEQSLYKTTATLSEKATFDGYEDYENQRPEVKKFLDLNRYSHAILAKTLGDREAFKRFCGQIDLNNLNNKQRFLLKLPAFIVKKLSALKFYLERKGIYLTAFK